MHNQSKYYRSESTHIELADIISRLDKKPDALAPINTPNVTLKDMAESYRVINHWESIGLLNDPREDGCKGWRKFTIIDYSWIAVIKKLRSWGLPLDKIKNVKNSIFAKVYKENDCVSWLEYAFLRTTVFTQKNNTYLIIYSDGESYITNQSEIGLNNHLHNIPSDYLIINLNGLWAETFPKKKITNHFENFVLLSDAEMGILHPLRTEENSSIKIEQSEDGEIKSIQKNKRHKIEKVEDIANMLSSVDYGNITIKKQDGKIVLAETNKKEKV